MITCSSTTKALMRPMKSAPSAKSPEIDAVLTMAPPPR